MQVVGASDHTCPKVKLGLASAAVKLSRGKRIPDEYRGLDEDAGKDIA